MTRVLQTARGPLALPAFLPVTTFGGRFPLDDLVRPYLRRFSPAIMVSYHYARQIKQRPKEILFIDSGGFASLFEGSSFLELEDYAAIRTREGDEISPPEVLALQEKHADIGATVDFLIPPDIPGEEASHRQALTLKNAMWALHARKRRSLLLYASVQAWDAESAARMTRALAPHSFDGYALGGMVPRIRRPDQIIDIVRAIRSVDTVRPLHVFGIGTPMLMQTLIAAGADSFDSSSFVRAAVDGKRLSKISGTWTDLDSDAQISGCEGALIAHRFGSDYLSLEGEANRMALALANLQTLAEFSGRRDQARIAGTSSSSWSK
jgi:tRNA-guanine family transglycosylase